MKILKMGTSVILVPEHNAQSTSYLDRTLTNNNLIISKSAILAPNTYMFDMHTIGYLILFVAF